MTFEIPSAKSIDKDKELSSDLSVNSEGKLVDSSLEMLETRMKIMTGQDVSPEAKQKLEAYDAELEKEFASKPLDPELQKLKDGLDDYFDNKQSLELLGDRIKQIYEGVTSERLADYDKRQEERMNRGPESEEMQKAREGMYKLLELQAHNRRYSVNPEIQNEQLKQDNIEFEKRMEGIKNLIDEIWKN